MSYFDTASFLAAFEDAADGIAKSIDEDTLRTVGFTGAAIFREEAKLNAQSHIQTGTIHRNIIVKRIEEESDGARRQVYLVTVRKGDYGGGDAYYWRFVEFGHKFVPRKPKSGRGSSWSVHRRAAALEYGTASAPAYPFMRPAYESKKREAVDAMTQALAEQIARNAR